MKSGESGSPDLDDSPDSFVLDRFDSFESKVLRGSTAEAKVDWPQRIENHCRYLVMERLRSKEVYEMWLRTSAASYQVTQAFFWTFGKKLKAKKNSKLKEKTQNSSNKLKDSANFGVIYSKNQRK